jgi:hypothetical protein
MNEYNGMKVGDLIGAYAPGFHELVKIEPRDVELFKGKRTTSPLFHYTIKFRSDGKPAKSKQIKTCDAAWCSPSGPLLAVFIERAETTLNQLKAIVLEQ